jgi:hypothetical protein
VDAYKVNRDWVHTETDYVLAKEGEAWSIAGCQSVPSDRDGQALGKAEMAAVGDQLDFDVTTAAQAWVDSPGVNHGVVMDCEGYYSSASYELASSEHPNEDWRPQLVIVCEYSTVTPVATATQTPTSLPTVTPSPSVWASPSETPGSGEAVYLPMVVK